MGELEPNAMRAGNDDRERVVGRLNTAFAEGRLDVGELDERVAAAYAAKTLGELVPLTADLPVPHQPPPSGAPAHRSPDRPAPRPRPLQSQSHSQEPMLPAEPGAAIRWAPLSGSLALFLVNVLIWAAVSVGDGELVYFWPVWTAIPLVIATVAMIGQRGRH